MHQPDSQWDVGRKAHWERVYATRKSTELSWYQASPDLSLDLITRSGADSASRIIDIGGGDSTLVDALLDRDLGRVTVLDISAAALERAKARLGPRACAVDWIEADVTRVVLPRWTFEVWHDRAVFHFLTRADDQRRYVDALRHALVPEGHAVVATFAADGPTRCSGLEVARYDAGSLAARFGHEFELVTNAREAHRTPAGSEQQFTYVLLRRRAEPPSGAT